MDATVVSIPSLMLLVVASLPLLVHLIGFFTYFAALLDGVVADAGAPSIAFFGVVGRVVDLLEPFEPPEPMLTPLAS